MESRHFPAVIAAEAGIQRLQSHASVKPWVPASAAMTAGKNATSLPYGVGLVGKTSAQFLNGPRIFRSAEQAESACAD